MRLRCLTPRALRSVCLIVCMAALTACATPRPHYAAHGPARVLVARRGWHIDVGFASQELEGPLSFVRTQFPDARYVFFGFGDERYIHSARHAGPALLQAIWPGRGVMLVTAITDTPAEAFGAASVASLPLTVAQRNSLAAFIGQSFAQAADDTAPLRKGPYSGSLYYASTAQYSGVHTCNTWAAEALRQAGLPVRSRGVLLAGQLWRQIRPLDRAGVP